MSIFFLEGLPGAGKSYESVIRHLLPALRAGRAVMTNVPGLDHDELKKHLGVLSFSLTYIDIDTPVREAVDAYIEACGQQNRPPMQQIMMTVAATKAQEIIDSVVRPDALFLLDEVQNYFGSSSGSLPVATIRFFAEHRHQGLDFILMGQHVGDVHDLIKHRIEVLTHLQKLTALGASGRYSWTNYTLSGGKRTKIRSGVEKYDKAIFAIYKSHDEGTKNKALYVDERNNIFNSAQFKYFLPVVFIIAAYALYWLNDFFFGSQPLTQAINRTSAAASSVSAVPAISRVPAVKPVNLGPASMPAAASAVASPVSAVSAVPASSPGPVFTTFLASASSVHQSADFYETFFQKYRARYSAFVQSTDRKTVRGYLDFVNQDQIVERLQFPSLLKAGFRFDLAEMGLLKISSPTGKTFLVSSWPVNSKTFEERSTNLQATVSTQKQ